MIKSLDVLMVEKYQCPGCMNGSDTNCGEFKSEDVCGGVSCKSHVAGTMMMGAGRINLGLPKGFNRKGSVDGDIQAIHIRLFQKMPSKNGAEFYNKFNVPVWAMEEDGDLFVRCYCPRVNLTYVDVIHHGKISDIMSKNLGTFDVGDFIEEID